MCGICGFTNAEPGAKDENILKNMCAIMAHRGPDGEGYYLIDGVALGHRRLSLIDIDGGAQPMLRGVGSTDVGSRRQAPSSNKVGDRLGHFAIVFNGEIYNYKDIAQELHRDGWEFSTTSDTEVLLTGYMAWGAGVLSRLRGMFAFAIWDPVRKQLFCARDPFGIKPFYYTLQGRQFIFASEIKSILEHPAYERKLNIEALTQYLCFQFSVLPETFFKGVFKLLPGHYMYVGQSGIEAEERYWQPEFNEAGGLCSPACKIDSAVHNSVRYHNVADVEVGSFLSSGIDSSYLAACLAQENPSIKTFTVGFSEYGADKGERDEISWASELAQLIGVENTSKHITQEEYWEALPHVQWHMDEPLADPSAVALYFVDQLAATQVKAVLSGEGADELFGGYKIYQAPLDARKVRWIPRRVLLAGARLLKKLNFRGANYLARAGESVANWYYTNAQGAAFSFDECTTILRSDLYSDLHSDLRSDFCRSVLTRKTPKEVVAPIYERVSGLDEPTQMQYLDILCWMVGDILLKTDKMSMAHSLESRVPFLDKEVFAVAAELPLNLRVTEKETKVALRKAASMTIPQAWASKEKLGFPVPIAKWFREKPNYERVKEWFLSFEAREFFDSDELLRILDEHITGKDNSRKIFIIWMFLLWYRIYFVDCAKPVS